MTAAPTAGRAARLSGGDVADVAELLERDFGRRPGGTGVLANQVLLDALDRGEHHRFVVWPARRPLGVIYVAPSGTLVPAGDPSAGGPLAGAAERAAWRVLVGDEPLSLALLESYPRKLFARRPAARRQRFMVVAGEPAALPQPEGFRRARAGDVPRLTELACRLHVEDEMGPPIARASLPTVRARMAEGVSQGLTWVVERRGQVVAKFDVSLRSRRRGAQLAGVYVDAGHRRQGIAATAVAALARELTADGLPGVTLHVRADNGAAIRAYERAGLRDEGAWTLALR